MKDNIQLIGWDQTENVNIGEMEYKDDGISIYTDIRELPIEENPIRMDMCVTAICYNGRLQLELNAETYTIHQKEILICKPNDVIANCMVSPDFNGAVLFLSRKYLLEQISESDIWDHAFHLLKKPVIQVNEESSHYYMLYYNILQMKVKQKRMPFHKEIVSSVIKAALYEMLSNAVSCDVDAADCKLQLEKAGDVLVKRFVELLSGSKIKQRSVAWYADSLCVTPKYLSTVCKQVTGKTAFHWINEYVQIDIRHWLKNSDKTIKEVADLLEFPNSSFFGKYCRAHFGLSPTELRKKLREQPDESK